jgi:hypothetical protein
VTSFLDKEGKEDVGRHTDPGALRTNESTDREKAGFTDTDRSSDCYKDYYISRGPIMGIEYSICLRLLQCWPLLLCVAFGFVSILGRILSAEHL